MDLDGFKRSLGLKDAYRKNFAELIEHKIDSSEEIQISGIMENIGCSTDMFCFRRLSREDRWTIWRKRTLAKWLPNGKYSWKYSLPRWPLARKI